MNNLTNKIKNALFAEYSANNISLLELARFLDDAESETLLNITSLDEAKGIFTLLADNVLTIKEFCELARNKNSYFEQAFCNIFWNNERTSKLLEEISLTQDDLKCLLNKIDNEYELNNLSINTSLIKYVLNEFILNKEDVDRFNAIIENSNRRKRENIHTLFDMIEFHNKNNEEILKLNKLNKYTYSLSLTKDQRDELIEVLKDNEFALNKLQDIVVNKLESTYDFESLMRYLKKIEKKTVLNI